MNRTIQDIEAKLTLLKTDHTMRDTLWNQTYDQLMRDLKRAHKANAFDYDGAIDATRRAEVEDMTREVDAPEYDRQWAWDLHRAVYAYAVIAPFVMGIIAAVVR